jgi:hypothetical protein
MTDQQAENFVKYVLNLRKNGIREEDLIIKELMTVFEGREDDFQMALELINTGAFRAAIISSGNSYPKGNLSIEDNQILKASFKLHWIELKGEDHYKSNYENKIKPWWRIWKQ